MDNAPSVEVGCCDKLALLWKANKPLAIFLLVLITLINLGIIFLILWFFVFNQGHGSTPSSTTASSNNTSTAHPTTSTNTTSSTSGSSSNTTAAAAKAAANATHAAYLHLRTLLSQWSNNHQSFIIIIIHNITPFPPQSFCTSE